VAVVGGLFASGRSPPPQVQAATAAPPAPAATRARPTPTAPAPSPARAATLTSPSGTVRILAPAAAAPAAGTVLALLDRHFTAINEHDYAAWSATVADRRARDQPESRWTKDYRSTHDSSVEVTAIDDAGSDALTVTLSFVSQQAVADAPSDLPAERICWQSRWPVVDVASGGRLDRPATGTTTRHAC
jgi:hypothetical protein